MGIFKKRLLLGTSAYAISSHLRSQPDFSKSKHPQKPQAKETD